jgi:hypothetical protein
LKTIKGNQTGGIRHRRIPSVDKKSSDIKGLGRIKPNISSQFLNAPIRWEALCLNGYGLTGSLVSERISSQISPHLRSLNAALHHFSFHDGFHGFWGFENQGTHSGTHGNRRFALIQR